MGSELVINSLPRKTVTELFWEAYPAYIAMGMPSDEYWNGDAQACVAYRKAHREKLDLWDAMLWRQGLYVYHALCAVAPCFNALKPSKPEEYLEQPFGITEKKVQQDKPNPALEYMKVWAERVNSMRKQKNG